MPWNRSTELKMKPLIAPKEGLAQWNIRFSCIWDTEELTFIQILLNAIIRHWPLHIS